MQYQAEMLVQVLQLAQARAQELIRAVPQEQGQLESYSYLLLLDVQKVARQAVALQELAERVLATGQAPLLEAPQVSKSELRRLRAQGLAEAEEQVEVLEPQAGELVEVPLQGLE
jgi:hypothetical protein